MSYNGKTGIIVAFGNSATQDRFAGCNTVKVFLRQPDGSEVVANAPVGVKLPITNKWADEKALPCIGDTVELGWDYQRFSGVIRERAISPGNAMPTELPVGRSAAFNLEDQLASLRPDPNNAEEMRIAAALEWIHKLSQDQS